MQILQQAGACWGLGQFLQWDANSGAKPEVTFLYWGNILGFPKSSVAKYPNHPPINLSSDGGEQWAQAGRSSARDPFTRVP